ncbi:cbb3-type cytochrome oxidase assembly protein CcoS [Devosia sp. RR2S18]|uniref:cbb3-type cytochrome oxidase assembly protein CcoS n=1 Tax=Devosia rhizosphaerae TaxID=3049774 RepID=UPI00254160FD|nr:cbb3-type cytochrome oxidase assembly protein CcoS [Devosia sp. RR2S18]WIJ26886.1 cbb3-type cytochrome oxidase assembly protein CcoS [Devosia sp. RR2S18]
MSDFFFLIPISVVLGAAGLVVFLWTLRDGQYEDLDGASQRVLFDADAPIVTRELDGTSGEPIDPPGKVS